MRKSIFGALAVSLCLSSAVMADPLTQARQAYIDGDYQAALTVLEPMAQAGDPIAQNIMGAAYADGRGVDADPEKAREWYEKAAASGLAKAYYNLGNLHKKAGRYDQAVTAYQVAMDKDYGAAFYERGKMLRHGIGGPVLIKQAIAAFERGMQSGSDEAGIELAEMYRLGEGVPLNTAKAREIYAELATYGNAVALGNLALMYEMGLGGAKDMAAAYALYRQAVDLGDENAAKNLAEFRQTTSGYWAE